MTPSPGPRPLEGLVALDLTIALAGPFATFLLAGLGARVIKIENPEAADPSRNNAPYLGPAGVTLTRTGAGDVSLAALNRLRGKHAVTLNLKRPGAREVFDDLIGRADVLVDNFSPGTLERLGVGYERLRTINPRLVACSITGFGSGPGGSGKAMDTIVQALSGLMMTSGAPDDPPVRVGLPVADMIAPLFGVIGILAALEQRSRTGLGQQVDVSMLGALTSMLAVEPFDLLEKCGVPMRTGPMVPRLAPFGVYPTQNGFVAICAPTETFARGLFKAMARPDLADDPRFTTRDARVAHVDALNAIIEAFTRQHTGVDLVRLLDAAGVPAAEVRAPADAVRDPRVVARGETVPLTHPEFTGHDEILGMGVPITFSDARVDLPLPAPGLGEHNDAIYGEFLGYTPDRIARLRATGVI